MIEPRTTDRGLDRGGIIDANRILTDLLVNFRRIVGRGLVTCLGDRWYREGLPGEVFRRLVVRKESETPLDRFSGNYEELLTYASFRDLAEIIAANVPLADRLRTLETRDGGSLQDRLHDLEGMRLAVKGGRSVTDSEMARLERYQSDFRAALKRKTRRQRPQPQDRPAPKPVRQVVPEVKPEDETLESIFGPEDEDAEVDLASSGKVDLKGWADELHSAEVEVAPVEMTDLAAVEAASLDENREATRTTPVVRVTTGGGRAPPPVGLVDDSEVVENAIAEGDDQAVLRALHMEVTEIAYEMLRHQPASPVTVWNVLHRSGWYDAKEEGFGLQPIATFYALVDEYARARDSEAKTSDLKNLLSEAEFSKLLLAMREVFLNCRVRG